MRSYVKMDARKLATSLKKKMQYSKKIIRDDSFIAAVRSQNMHRKLNPYSRPSGPCVHVAYGLCLIILLFHQPPPNQEGVEEAEASDAASVVDPDPNPPKPCFKLA